MAKNKSKQYSKKRPSQNRIWMAILAVLGGMLLIAGAFSAINRPTQSRAQTEVSGRPSLKVDQDKVDLGDVKLGKTVEVSFQLTNAGDQTLRFTKSPYIEVLEGC